MAFGDLAQALAALAVAEDSFAIDGDGLPADVPALEPGAPHAGAHPLDDQVAFKLRDRTDDDDDSPAQRAGRIDRLAEADELDVEAIELVQDLEEVPGRACDAITGPDQDDVELTAAGIPHQVAEPWSAGLHPADPVRVLVDDLITTLRGHLAQIVQLGLRVLVDAGDPRI